MDGQGAEERGHGLLSTGRLVPLSFGNVDFFHLLKKRKGLFWGGVGAG